MDSKRLTCKDTTKGDKREPGDFPQCSWEGKDKGHDETDDAKDNRAGSILCQGIHHHGEGEYMASHDENEEE